MIFNSVEFLVFLAVVFAAYWALPFRGQNILLLIASYVFYGWWDWRFLALIAGSSIFDFMIGRLLSKEGQTDKKRKRLVAASVVLNLTFLGFFKYFGFFVDSMAGLLGEFGAIGQALSGNLNIILPVGISFYTFQSISYIIDVYRKHISAEKSLLRFMTYVAFFPQLVAGPIERAPDLLPQFRSLRRFDWALAVDGSRQMLWGFFKKIVIADNLAIAVNDVYGNAAGAGGAELLMATLFFAFQIYCDFSGYSDIAIGCARLFGFSLTRNFAYPYFSRNIPEFWKRWHISLSTWFRDYVFIPLGGSRVGGRSKYLRNVMITFMLSGFWHGANWTYLVWGAIHGLAYLPSMLSKNWQAPTEAEKKARKSAPSFRDIPAILATFCVVLLSWVFFRATSIGDAFMILGKIFEAVLTLEMGAVFTYPMNIALIIVLVGIEWIQRTKAHPLMMPAMPKPVRWSLYYAVVVAIIFLGVFTYTPFIYFQF